MVTSATTTQGELFARMQNQIYNVKSQNIGEEDVDLAYSTVLELTPKNKDINAIDIG